MLKSLKISIKNTTKLWFYYSLNKVNFINRSQTAQLILMNQYRQLKNTPNLPKFQDVGLHICSQTDEDGFLLFIFSLIDTTNKKVVELCAGDGIECNAANLIINHGWNGLLFDGDLTQIKLGQEIYEFINTTKINPPKLVNAWITAENVNQLITTNGFNGEIDLLSLDLDGVDYWIWKSIDCINPRVVVIEYNTYWGAEKSVTVPYDPQFQAQIFQHSQYHPGYYCGASLRAFGKLAKDRGYRLVGSNTKQWNAFFIRNDIATDLIPEVSIESCLSSHQNSKSTTQNNWSFISELPWENV
ncbi:MAG TPA: hypothetical protein DCL61_14010 [Cyanobacteria bacterium UBA12227]|nr:hypothetical protein [Cyanobacteria bacterium UBA12227]HAX86965.1 hypothetical protein [Cyanobacteria bacterium UBA11370]HBY76896.1 hypothetical protein [Cyanobacteria bacterium UBA11148]